MSIYETIEKKLEKAEKADREEILEIARDIATEYVELHILSVKIMNFNRQMYKRNLEKLEVETKKLEEKLEVMRLENSLLNEVVARVEGLARVGDSRTAFYIMQELERRSVTT